MPLLLPPFERTVCACSDCTDFCLKSPGHLIPADLFRLADLLLARRQIEAPADVLNFLQASKGAVVGDTATGRRFRIGTIVPKRDPSTGHCIFLTEDYRCSIHEISPFGCAFFDTHMSRIEGNARSMWGLRQIMGTPAYEQARQKLAHRDGGEYEPFTPSQKENQ